MRKTAVQIAVLAGILLAVCLICRFTVYDSYKIIHALPSNMSFDEPVLTLTDPGVVHIRSAQVLGGVIKIEVEPAGKGETFIEISDRVQGRAGSVALRVDRFGFIYDKNTGGFTGEMIDCSEGVLEWVDKTAVEDLPIWEGDKLFFRLLADDSPFFS